MGYGDSPRGTPIGGGRRTTKKKKAKRAKKAKKAKRACKYGPRDADGYCPKKPSRFESGDVFDALEPPRRVTSRASATRRRLTTGATKAAQQLVEGVVRSAANPATREAVKAVGRLNVRDVAASGAAGYGLLGGVALAGIAAYALTTYLVHRKPKKREEQLAAAAEAAQAYRAARVMAAESQGKPLTAAQQRVLAAEFKKKLAALGITNFSQKG